jgi:excisionase family DNA binding protein
VPTKQLTDRPSASWDKPALAAYLGVSVSGVDKLIASKKAPPGFRVGRLWRWRPSAVEAWARQQETARDAS